MNLLYFVILIPLISFLLLALAGKGWNKENIILIGISAIGLICVLIVFICFDFYHNSNAGSSLIYSRYLWQWFSVNDFKVSVTLLLDGLSLVFLIIIAVVALLIHIYAAGYLGYNDAYIFFAYGNFLIANILVVILVDNVFVMLLGWEGISLCSYLLVGFYNRSLQNSFAALRTFIIMHIGDIFLFFAICLIYSELHNLNMREIILLANNRLATDSEIIYWITLFLFWGAIGKAAQLPLHIWLTDTASIPIPALTLIHSASAVLAGIYLITRFGDLFMLSNDTLWIIGVIASLTLISSACSALVQNDIKQMTAYMSLSQICYVFFGISVEAWNEALFYLINYMAFSTLLFLSSASMIQSRNCERDIRKMGTKIRNYPFIYLCFLVAAASIGIIPWVTATFYSKGDILWATAVRGNIGFTAIGLVGILLSTIAIFRIIFIIFHSRNKTIAVEKTFNRVCFNHVPLGVLAIFSLCLFNNIPLPSLGLLPTLILPKGGLFSFQLLLAAITILGILITYILFASKNSEIDEIADSPIGRVFYRLWYSGWKIERIYYVVFVRFYFFITNFLKRDPLNTWVNVVPIGISRIHTQISKLENGHLRWYITSIVVGAVGIFLLLVFV